jgi:hypothetical protein
MAGPEVKVKIRPMEPEDISGILMVDRKTAECRGLSPIGI